MSSLRHVVLLLCYALPAAALGLYLPHWLPVIDRGMAIGAGVTVLLAGALAHEVRARLARQICSTYVSPSGYLPARAAGVGTGAPSKK